MIVRDFNFVGIASLPSETNPILIVAPDTVLPAPVSSQPFEAIPPWNSKFADVSDSIDLIELPPGNLPQDTRTSPPGIGALPTEQPYHGSYYNGIMDVSAPSKMFRDNPQSLSWQRHRHDTAAIP